LGWVGLGWVGLGWVGLGWVGLGWVGLGWVGLVRNSNTLGIHSSSCNRIAWYCTEPALSGTFIATCCGSFMTLG